MKKEIYVNWNGKKTNIKDIIKNMKLETLKKYEEAAEEYQENEKIGLREICKKYHLGHYIFPAFLKYKNIDIRRSHEYSLKKCKLAMKEYEKGKSTNYLNDELHIGHSILSSYLKSKNIKIRGKRIHFVDEDFFLKINTELKAYILGLICADGCIDKKLNCLTILLQRIDRKYLEEIAKIFNVSVIDGESYDKRTGKMYKNSVIHICSRKLVNTLLHKGITPKKSLTMTAEVFNHIPEGFLPAFIRGNFDGDGCVSKTSETQYQMNICGTEKMMNYIKKIFEKEIGTNINNKLHKNGNIYYLQYAGNCLLIKIREYLYGENPTIFLERKKKIFDGIICNKMNNKFSSQYNGVSFIKKRKKWKMTLKKKGICNIIEIFDSDLEAAKAYDKYIIDNNLPKYKLNFQEDY